MLHLLLDDTPNTLNYMLAGYTVLIGVPILYVVSLVVRRQRVKHELEMLAALAKEKEAEKK